MLIHSALPRAKWKLVERISHSEAARLTNGNTDKFMDQDYWILGDDTKSNDVPIGAKAVYYKDRCWFTVEKVRD